MANTHTLTQPSGAIFRRTFEFPAELWLEFEDRAKTEGISLRTLLIESMNMRLAQPRAASPKKSGKVA